MYHNIIYRELEMKRCVGELGIERELASRADQRISRWFEHVERMDEYRMARRVLMAESGGRVQGRPRLGWMDGVKVALGNRGMTVEAARQCAYDRKEWRALGSAAVQLVHIALQFRLPVVATVQTRACRAAASSHRTAVPSPTNPYRCLSECKYCIILS